MFVCAHMHVCYRISMLFKSSNIHTNNASFSECFPLICYRVRMNLGIQRNLMSLDML